MLKAEKRLRMKTFKLSNKQLQLLFLSGGFLQGFLVLRAR